MNYRRQLIILIPFVAWFFLQCTEYKQVQKDDWQTYYEKSGCLKTPRYDETAAYCRRLADASSWIEFADFGLSAQGRKLPLVIVDKDKRFSPQKPGTRKKAVVLIQACIHPGESDGKDAGLMLIRDIVLFGKYPQILDNVTLLFIPIFNVDGHERFSPYNRINQHGPEEMGWRVTANCLNLNRDYCKADAPEMRAWLALFNAWLPDLLADCHVTNGADYQYAMTYSVETHDNMCRPVLAWTKDAFVPYIEGKMAESGFPLFPYVSPKDWYDLTSGLCSFAWGPRYSTGYGVVQNRPFLLLETHMLKPYKIRVDATYELLRHSLQCVAQDPRQLMRAVQEADSVTAQLPAGSEYVLQYDETSDSTLVEFKGVAFHKEKSDISGGEIVQYDSVPQIYTLAYFDKVKPAETARLPYAYLIPPEWHDVIGRLSAHGIVIRRLNQPVTLSVESYRFNSPSWRAEPYEGRHSVTFEQTPITQQRVFAKGTAVIFMNQRTNRVIAHLLEPKGPDSFVAWGFFDAIFERKEYAEYYILEKLAHEMLAENDSLKMEFEQKLATDTAFAANPRERLYFFYKRSPFWDAWMNVYPVGKVMKMVALPVE